MVKSVGDDGSDVLRDVNQLINDFKQAFRVSF